MSCKNGFGLVQIYFLHGLVTEVGLLVVVARLIRLVISLYHNKYVLIK